MVNPKDYSPRGLVAKVLLEGRPPFVVVPFPRLDAAGNPITNVHMRLLTVAEEDLALARARQEHQRLLREHADERGLTDEELLTNLRACHILSFCCRNPEDPEQPFFEHGARDVQQFDSEEIAQLMLHYAALKEQAWPSLRTMTKDEVDNWIRIFEEGVLDHPFSQLPRGRLEALCASLVTRLGEKNYSS